MVLAYAARIDANDPLGGLVVGERPEPAPRDGWTNRRAALGWTQPLRYVVAEGVGLPADRLADDPSAATAPGSTPTGNEVIVHAVVPQRRLDLRRDPGPAPDLLSEIHDGTLPDQVAVPAGNLVAKPEGMPWEMAACLSTA